MDFEFTADQHELRDNARAVLSTACPPSLVRSVFEGDAGGVDELWQSLVDLGWPAIGVDEANGGLGLTFVETGLVVEELGRVVAPSPFLATVTQFAPMVRECGGDGSWLAKVADGSITGTIAVADNGVFPLLGGAPATVARREGDAWVLDGAKTHVVGGATADEIAVVAAGDGGPGVFVVPSHAVTATPVDTIDPTMALATITFDQVEVRGERVVAPPGSPEAMTGIGRAMDEVVTAMALSTVATCRAIFEATLEYAKVREQFGRPIGSFQALKHRFADMYLSVEKASSLAYFAALTIAEDDQRRTTAASMAKAAAGDCQRLLARDGLQLHGGVGFTWENDLHFWLKRAKTGDFLFGNAAAHRAWLAKLMGLTA